MGEGYPVPGPDGGYLISGPDEDTTSQVQMGGRYLVSGPDVGGGGGGTPSQVWSGYPSQVWMGGGTPILLMGGTPSKIRMGGTLPILDWMGYPPIRRQISIASTCYTAGGVPLAFTQEDFLVEIKS